MKRCSALVTAICLVLSACKDEPAAADPKADTPAPAGASPTSTPPTQGGATPTPPTSPLAKPIEPVAAPAITPSYPVALDPLLELVPAGAEQYLVIRDVNEILDDSKWFIDSVRPSMLRAMELDSSPDPKAIEVVKNYDVVRGKIGASGIDFDRGFVVIGNGEGADVIVFASANVEAFNELQVALGDTPKPMKCTALTAFSGYVACAEKDDGTLAKYVPAKDAAARRTELSAVLAGVDLEQANVLGRWKESSDDGVNALAIATAPGLVEVHVAPRLDEEFEAFAAAGAAPALALAPKGSSFVWGRFAPSFVSDKAKGAPALIGNVAATLTGEYFFGSLADPAALVLLVGVSDPGPAAALVPMYSLIDEKVPKALPDGTTLALKVEPVDVGTGTSVQTLHATGTGPRADLFTKLGLVQEGVAFVAGKYGVAALGAGTSVVGRLATFEGSTTDAPVTSVLPADFATALRDGKVSLAVHVELDALQNAAMRELIGGVLAELPASGDELTPKQWLDIAIGMLAPLSSTSLWITKDGPSIVHVAFRGFGDPSTEEGKAAYAALVEIAEGKRDAKTVYAELAGRSSSSARAFAYAARAEGSLTAIAPAIGGVALSGLFVFFAFMGREKKDVAAVSR